MHFKKSPFHYDRRFNNLDYIHSAPTPALIIGDLVHTIVLEPHKSDDRYVIKPHYDRRTKSGKIEHEKFMCSVQNRMIVEQEMLSQALQMALAVRNNELAQAIIHDAKIEQSIYFTHEPTGLQCKVRPDIWNNTLVSDLKTTKDASYNSFQRSSFGYGYFLQAGMIWWALKSIGIVLEKFVFIVIEKEFPNAIAIYELAKECIEYGVEQFDKLIKLLAECQLKQSFPSYAFSTLYLPNYAKYEDLGEIQHDDE